MKKVFTVERIMNAVLWCSVAGFLFIDEYRLAFLLTGIVAYNLNPKND